MKKLLSFVALFSLLGCTVFSQKEIANTLKRQMEAIDRGIVAVRKSPDEVFISMGTVKPKWLAKLPMGQLMARAK